MTKSLLVIAPHPDDEILGAGAIMARTIASGGEVAVAVLTDGSRSDPGADRAALAARRQDEYTAGLMAMLGQAVPTCFLGQPDGRLSSTAIDLSEEGALMRFIAAAAPDTIIVTDPADGHPDHKAAFGLAARLIAMGLAAKLLVVPISQRIDGPFDSTKYQEHPVDPLAVCKAAALACHGSQIAQGSGFILAPEMLEMFCENEYSRTVFDANDSAADAVSADHFNSMFTASADPWHYDSEPYERDRFRRTIAALGDRRYGSAIELGCANGALTELLAPLCDRLCAADASEVALYAARSRLAGVANVSAVHLVMPDDLPAGPFDLIVASDMLYYLGLQGVIALMAGVERAAGPDCRLLLASYLGDTATRLTGEMAAEAAIAMLPTWRVIRAQRTERLRLEVLERR
jgi:LmbE family N-acetylglucosaminyl deacetylase/SAM-dependent methyltransferase